MMIDRRHLLDSFVAIAIFTSLLALVTDRFLVIALASVFLALFSVLLRQRFVLRLPSYLVVSVGVLLCAIVMTGAVSVLPSRTFVQSSRTALGVGLMLVFSQIGAAQRVRRWSVFGLSLLAVAFAVLMPVLVTIPPQNKLPVVPAGVYVFFHPRFSDSANPNVMAGTLSILFPLLFAVPMSSRWRVGQVASIAATALAIILLQSRGALTGVVAAVAAMICVRLWRIGLRLPVIAATALALLPVAIVVTIHGADPDYLLARVSGLVERQSNWQCGWNLIQDFMFTGYGMGTFNEVCTSLYPGLLREPDVPHAHNMYLQVAGDLGIFGFVSWITCQFAVLRMSWRALWHSDLEVQAVAVALLGAQVVLLTHGLTDSPLWGMTRPSLITWVLWGIALALPCTRSDHAVKEAHVLNQIPPP
jgi:O-antigen ligase